MKYTILLLLVSTTTLAQVKGTKVGISNGMFGGSHYDVPTGTTLDKYGPERLAPKGLAFTGTLESDKLGNVFFRQLNVVRATPDKTKLGKQLLFLYDSPIASLNDQSRKIKIGISGKLIHMSQDDHFMYFKVNGEHTPDIEKNLTTDEYIIMDQSQTFVAPQVDFCGELKKSFGAFDIEGFAQANLAPVGMLQYHAQVTNNQTTQPDMSKLNKGGVTLAFGGELVVQGIAKYKDKIYLKVRIQQSAVQGVDGSKSSNSSRIGHYELGYLITENLSAGVSVQNNEQLLHNKDRHSIEVYNIVGVNLAYKIPRLK